MLSREELLARITDILPLRENPISGHLHEDRPTVGAFEVRDCVMVLFDTLHPEPHDIGLTCERCEIPGAFASEKDAIAAGWKDVTMDKIPGWLCPSCSKATPSPDAVERAAEAAFEVYSEIIPTTPWRDQYKSAKNTWLKIARTVIDTARPWREDEQHLRGRLADAERRCKGLEAENMRMVDEAAASANLLRNAERKLAVAVEGLMSIRVHGNQFATDVAKETLSKIEKAGEAASSSTPVEKSTVSTGCAFPDLPAEIVKAREDADEACVENGHLELFGLRGKVKAAFDAYDSALAKAQADAERWKKWAGFMYGELKIYRDDSHDTMVRARAAGIEPVEEEPKE